MAKRALIFKVQIEGVRETLRAFSALPKEASNALRDRSLELSKELAAKIKLLAAADSRQAALMVPTIKAVRDRVPAIQAGGTRKVGRNSVPAYKVLFGSEFGSNALAQFRGHNPEGYWFRPAVITEGSMLEKAWHQAADDAVRAFSREANG